MNLWDWLFVKLTGINVGIVGMRGAGKTRLHEFLRTGQLIDTNEYYPTLNPTGQQAARRRLPGIVPTVRDSRISIREGIDVPGNIRGGIAEWKSEVCESSIVLYLFDAYKVWSAEDSRYGEEMLEQCVAVDALLDNRPVQGRKDTRILMFGTHCDQGPAGTLASHSAQASEFYANVFSLTSVRHAKITLSKSIAKPAGLILGSLLTIETSSEVCWRLFNQP